MSILDGFTPAGVVGTVVEKVLSIVTKFVPDKNEAAKMTHEVLMSQLSGDLAAQTQQFELLKQQILVNLEEAKSDKWWKAGWRPYIGWGSGTALLYSAMFEPFLRFIATVAFGYHGTFPVVDTTLTMQVLFAILGVGAMRSYDKQSDRSNKDVS